MDQMKRYAVYYAPRPGAFASCADEWLGRDATTGRAVPQPVLPDLDLTTGELTVEARRYGFHGTLRAPFRPALAVDGASISAAVASLAARLQPVRCDGLLLENLQGFLALTPVGCEAALLDLAAAVVEATDALRAPLTAQEIARRHPDTLSTRQRELLGRLGYPFVMDEFRFHLTLTDRLLAEQAGPVKAALGAHFAHVLPQPFEIQDLCLFGEDDAGLFHLLHRYALTG